MRASAVMRASACHVVSTVIELWMVMEFAWQARPAKALLPLDG